MPSLIDYIRSALDWTKRIAGQIVDWLRRRLEWVSGLLRRERTEPEPAPDAPASSPQPSAAQPEPINPPAEDRSDREALARMLASEDRAVPAKVVIGWITVQKARARKTSLFELLTSGKGYGPQDRRKDGKGVMYASTAKTPSDTDRQLAAGLLDGSIRPSAAIRSHAPGGWVERGQGMSDEAILSRQTKWNEGIYAGIADTKWVLFSRDSKPLVPQSGQTATAALDALPKVPAIENPLPAVA